MKTLYYCDPEKSKATCKRTTCMALGSEGHRACDCTSHIEYVKTDARGEPMVKVKLP